MLIEEKVLIDEINKNDDVGEKLKRLSSKADELQSLSTEKLLEICKEILSYLYHQSDEWSNANDWTMKWSRVNGFQEGESGKCDKATQVENSLNRFLVADHVRKVIEIYVEKLQLELLQEGEGKSGTTTKKPKLLENVRTFSINGGNKEYSIFRKALDAIPNHDFELWARSKTTDKENEAQEDELKESDLGPVTLVLAAGNQPFLSAVDVIDCLLYKRRPVLIKHHPLRPFMMEPYSMIFEPLIRRGYFQQILDESIPKTTEILSNLNVGHVHITGSLATDKAVRKTLSKSRSLLSETEIANMVTSELGCVTPAIMMPAEYTESELHHAVKAIVDLKKANGGCNCLNVNAIVLSKEWEQKDEFRELLIQEMKKQPTSPAYYPGSRERRSAIKEKYESLGRNRVTVAESTESRGYAPNPEDDVVICECGTPGETGYNDYALKAEAFGPVLAIVELDPSSSGDIKEKSENNNNDDNNGNIINYAQNVLGPFLNNKDNIYGSLSCALMSPASVNATAVEYTVASLKYGTVAVNCATFMGYEAMAEGAVWGAHCEDKSRQSGHGYVGNVFGVERVDRTVVYGPPLTKAPLGSPSAMPAILFDVIHAMTCAPSKYVSVLRLFHIITVRSLGALISPILPKQSYKDFVSKYGNALVK